MSRCQWDTRQEMVEGPPNTDGPARKLSAIGEPMQAYREVAHAVITSAVLDLINGRMKWTPIFGPAAKVVFGACSNRERSRYHEEDPYEAQPGVQMRIADSTGIELGELLEQASADVRTALGLERPTGR